jgi:uncharacterized protein YecE (DUF72 family)
MNSNIRIGTCSWNYDSWVGLVYRENQATALEYLREYSVHFNTAGIDSWFYRIPLKSEVKAYAEAVGSGFRFTCKVPQEVTLTPFRKKDSSGKPAVNPGFLSSERFGVFLGAIEPLLPRINSIMFEFEYLNREKMGSLDEFLDRLGTFFCSILAGLPYAIELRNKNYLVEKYFAFLSERRLEHVFSEKLYLPDIYDIYPLYQPHAGNHPVVRLLGGDRGEIEGKTEGNWDRIVDEKDKSRIADMVLDISKRSKITINVNNHYEGSAPLTTRALQRLLC